MRSDKDFDRNNLPVTFSTFILLPVAGCEAYVHTSKKRLFTVFFLSVLAAVLFVKKKKTPLLLRITGISLRRKRRFF